MPLRIRAALGATFCLFAVLTFPAAAPARDAVWLAASDLHLDPFDRSGSPSPPGRDTNPALLDSALRAMQRAVPDPAVVVLPGDLLAHRFAQLAGRGDADAAAASAVRGIAQAFGRAFPHAQFVVALGNNDAPCADYASDLNGRFLRAAAKAWAPLVDRRNSSPGFSGEFARRGYYAIALPAQHLRIVVLDTVFFSAEYRGLCGGRRSDAPAAETAWLRDLLASTPPGVRNAIVMHVPPGYDAFSTEVTHGFVPWPFMQPVDSAAMLDAIGAASDRVAFGIAGHAHRFDFRLAGGVPIVVLGAVSPIYRNAPVFYALHVGSGGELRDVDAYAFDAATRRWSAAHSFDREWKVSRIGGPELARIHARLAADPGMRRAWGAMSVAWVGSLPPPLRVWNDATWRIPWCAQTVMGRGFAQCAGIERRALAGRALVVAVAVLAAIGFAYAIRAGMRVFRARRRRRS
jgi:hypothetical protein